MLKGVKFLSRRSSKRSSPKRRLFFWHGTRVMESSMPDPQPILETVLSTTTPGAKTPPMPCQAAFSISLKWTAESSSRSGAIYPKSLKFLTLSHLTPTSLQGSIPPRCRSPWNLSSWTGLSPILHGGRFSKVMLSLFPCQRFVSSYVAVTDDHITHNLFVVLTVCAEPSPTISRWLQLTSNISLFYSL